jgi:diguanylate cyclase (GGDEF)-like protein
VAGFELTGELGRGGYTVTYRVRRHSSEYAMKVLQRHGEEPTERAFRREAALLASVNHPGLVRVHEVGVANDQPYLVMDSVDGRPLSSLVADGPLPVEQAVQIGVDVATALAAAHAARLVHRDIKPSNILVGADGHARLIDFGLAVRPGTRDETTTAGTLLYCAPEQSGMLRRPIDGRADLYALGAVMYEGLTGRPPFISREIGELLRLHASTPPADPRALRPDLPAAVAEIVTRLLAKDPDDRYQSAVDLVTDLRQRAGAQTNWPLPDQRGDPPMIGREDELQTLRQCWAQALGGTGGVVLVEGEAGSGKTRLARELVAQVGASGGLVLAGKCEPEEGVPLAPLRRALADHLAAVRARPEPQRAAGVDRVRAAAGAAAPLLRGLLPALADLLEAPELTDDDDRHRQLPVAVSDFLASLAVQAGGAVLHIDDVQWIDPGTRRVLQRLAEQLSTVPLLVLVTARDDPASADAVAALRAAVGGGFGQTLRMRSLPADAVGPLVSSATGGLRVDRATAASLAARSGGNTFTLLQFLDAILDAGLLRPDWGCWRLDLDALQSVDLAEDDAELILRRLDGLDEDSRRVLSVAAVHGSQFDYPLIADACDLTHQRVLEIADAAAWRNLIERRGLVRFGFLHDRIRDALLERIDETELRALHERLADVLAPAGRSDPETVFALARHCQLGEPDRDPARVYRACHAAGQLALAQHVPAAALGYLQRAAEAAQTGELPPDPALLFHLATAQYRVGRFAEAIGTAEAARRASQEPLQRARILYLLSLALDTAWETKRVSEAVVQGLAELGRAPSSRRSVFLVNTLWTVLLGRLVELTGVGHGSARGERRERFRLEAALLSTISMAYLRRLALDKSLVYLLRCVYPVARIGPGAEDARMRIMLSSAQHVLGLRRGSRRNARRALAVAAGIGDPVLSAYIAWAHGITQHYLGLDQGEALHRVINESARWLEVGVQNDALLILIWDALQRGEVRAAERLADRRAALVALIGQLRAEGSVRFEHGAAARAAAAGLLAWQDRAHEAAPLLEFERDEASMQLWEQQAVFGAAMTVAYEGRDLGEAFDRAVERFEALRLPVKAVLPVALGFFLSRAQGRIEQVRLAPPGQRRFRLEQAQAALAPIRQAARVPLLRAHCEVARANLLQAAGQPRRALRQLGRCEPLLVEVDAPVLAFDAARVRALALRDLGVTGESDRQVQAALAIAREQGWPHRIRLIRTEFGLADKALVRDTAITNETIALGRLRQRLEAIEQLGLAASGVLDPDRLTPIALDQTIRLLGAERAFLFLVESEQLVPKGGRDADGHDIGELTGFTASTVERVYRSRQPIVITGSEEGEALGAHSVVLHGLRSIMVAPIQLDNRLLGVVYLDSRVAKGIFTAEDVGVLAAITNHIAFAIETARAAQLERAVAAATRQRDLAETLRDSLAEITGALEPDPEAVLRRLAATVIRHVGGERAWLVLGTASDTTVRVHPGQSTMEVEPELAELLASETTVSGHETTGRPKLLDDDARGWLSVPLRTRSEPVGLLMLASSSPQAYDDGRADIATTLSGHAMIAYENARLFAQVQHLAAIDDLTGIANRRHFFDLAARELARARRDGHHLLAMMLDIDHFKNINDQYGHQVGDEVIQLVAERLRRFVRPADILGRYGGEEFALMLPAGPDDPRALAERLRAVIAEHPVDTRVGPMTVTVSVGVAHLRSGDADVSSLLGRADRCLYDAKRGGRNRVEVD